MNSSIRIVSVTFQHHWSGLGIGTGSPTISWRFDSQSSSDCHDWTQDAYDVQISPNASEEGEIHHIQSSASIHVPWPTKPLRSRERTHVRVRSMGTLACPRATPWSSWYAVECALLRSDDWIAKPISMLEKERPNGPLRPILFRKTIPLDNNNSPVVQARLYITAGGVYRPFINGILVSNHEMAPGWTSYKHRHCYQTLDVTRYLSDNVENIIGIEVAEGWHCGRLGFLGGRRYLYSDKISVLAQLEIDYQDESRQTIATGIDWKCSFSPIISSEIYDGETYDASQEQPGWASNNQFNESNWVDVDFATTFYSNLSVSHAPPIKVTQIVEPLEIITTPNGKTVIDFGQNLVGKLWVRHLSFKACRRITFQHVEVLEAGEPATRPLRGARNLDTVITGQNDLRDWSPAFTFHGFRYVVVEGWSCQEDKTPLTLESVSALVMHSDMRRTGWFDCSNDLVNRLHNNAVWSMRGNFLSIPMDCPQRDERLGWTGDIQIFGPSACFLYDTTALLTDWLKDVAAEQREDGGIPAFVTPNVITHLWRSFPQAVWDDVTVILPWTLYLADGDERILRTQAESMKTWVDVGVRRGSDGLWDQEVWQLGDWLDPTAPPQQPGNGRTDGTLVADAYLVRVTFLLSKICRICGDKQNALRYQQDAIRLRITFQEKYITPKGFVAGDTQTALSLCIIFDLFKTETQRKVAGQRLCRLVRLASFRVATGFVGTPIITHALTSTGHTNVAYRMLLETNCPSWLYPITMGATTCWERWDSMQPDGTVNPGEMTSFNHYALGSIINWLHETVGGLKPLEPGWRSIGFQPRPGGGLTSARTVHEGPYGRIESHWKLVKLGHHTQFQLRILVPPNSTAKVWLPSYSTDRGILVGSTERDAAIRVGSGLYEFECNYQIVDEDILPLLPTYTDF